MQMHDVVLFEQRADYDAPPCEHELPKTSRTRPPTSALKIKIATKRFEKTFT